MRKKLYYLGTCSTCTDIMKRLDIDKKGFDKQDIKVNNINPEQLDEIKAITGSYDSLFSRRAMKYKELGLKDKKLTEKQIRKLILDEYTFLKRPVFLIGNKVFAGSEKKNIAALEKELSGKP